MKLPISRRLLCCARQVPPGARVADIGTDHGYLAIELLLHGEAACVHACDLRRQPLERAMENALRFGVADRMRFSQADGLRAVGPGEVDTVVCAGMGGDLIISILSRCPWLRQEPPCLLVLQAQSSGQELRRWLTESGFGILGEELVEESGFLYQVLRARYGLHQTLTPGEHYLSPQLLASGDPLLPDYYARIRNSLEKTVAGIRQAACPEEKLTYYETALAQIRAMEPQIPKGELR